MNGLSEEQAILLGWRDAMKWLRNNIEALPAPCTRPDVLAFMDRHTAIDGNYHWPAIRQLVEQREAADREVARVTAAVLDALERTKGSGSDVIRGMVRAAVTSKGDK